VKYEGHLRDRIVSSPTALAAKRMNNRLKKEHPIDVEAWTARKRDVMKRAVKAKFEQNPELHDALVATHPRPIRESNIPHDDPDMLGQILMEVRTELMR
jgi:predicted NAD-dependent protein-ADP-ribosyltransferase YbiA (DUF1768 family)